MRVCCVLVFRVLCDWLLFCYDIVALLLDLGIAVWFLLLVVLLIWFVVRFALVYWRLALGFVAGCGFDVDCYW